MFTNCTILTADAALEWTYEDSMNFKLCFERNVTFFFNGNVNFLTVQETFDIANCKIFQPLVRSGGVCVCDYSRNLLHDIAKKK